MHYKFLYYTSYDLTDLTAVASKKKKSVEYFLSRTVSKLAQFTLLASTNISLKVRALNNECKSFSPILCFYTKIFFGFTSINLNCTHTTNTLLSGYPSSGFWISMPSTVRSSENVNILRTPTSRLDQRYFKKMKCFFKTFYLNKFHNPSCINNHPSWNIIPIFCINYNPKTNLLHSYVEPEILFGES